MKATHVTVKWDDGLRMRTAARLVRLARRFRSRICVRMGPRIADGRSLLSIRILSASLGSPLDIEASGNDEYEAIQAMESFFDGGT